MTTTTTLEARMANPAALLPGVGEAIGGLVGGRPLGRPARAPARPRPPARQPDQRLRVLRPRGAPGTRAPPGRPTTASRRSGSGARPRGSPTPSAPRSTSPSTSRAWPTDRDAVPDAVWAEATRHFDEPALAALLLWIATSNLFNRMNVPTRQVAGTGW